MRHILIAYALMSLIIFALLTLLSYGHGVGYVYIYWRDWQLQTNVWALFIALAVLSLVAQSCWYILKRYLSRAKRQRDNVFNFKNLHPYEQLAVIWLLDAGRDQQDFIQRVFQHSTLLQGVMDARLANMQGQPKKALLALNYTHSIAFELAELQRIEIYLAEKDAQQALTHLEFLHQHALSPWLEDVAQAYQKRLNVLWAKFALQFPWAYLRATQYGHLPTPSKIVWLEQLLQQFEQANPDDLNHLKQRYMDLLPEIEQKTSEVKRLWLKLLVRLEDMQSYATNLAEHLLLEQFHEDVFYLWFEQQMLQSSPDYNDTEQHIMAWEEQYASVPVLSFAKYYVYRLTDRHHEADNLMSLYPEHVLMSYLRVQHALKQQPELLRQLNIIFENNPNHITIKL
ncbi:heme biosynthesis protein HemY [uncultured Acinetobacter sp.]|uniref:heme biosynthesis protein HemY n=1 Tax=uncultured Acinetobacter sp. TaxID=165433 RepID=UPI002636A870|nr:heme biosynthesis protein HemY [uncultured Acinetobacter sp.]